jgi:hypothetical protein
VTIAVAIAVPEGIVLAADSRGTFNNPQGWPKVATDNVRKVFKVSKSVGACTFGWGMLNGKSIASHVEELSASFPDTPIDDLRPAFIKYFEDECRTHMQVVDEEPPEGRTALGFFLAGYGSQQRGEVFFCGFPGDPVRKPVASASEDPGMVWQGQRDIVTRLIKGFDPRLDTSTLTTHVKSQLKDLEYTIYFARMVLQDAVDLAILLIRTTIETQRFTDGTLGNRGDVPGCGGGIDVAVVTRSHGFQWVQRKLLHGHNDHTRSLLLNDRPTGAGVLA